MLEKQNSYVDMDYDVPKTRPIRMKEKLYAKAIYDNFADAPDELAFKKGDVLTVIEQDTEGIRGWWLCTLRGRQGLCPGNRLRILNSYDSGCFSPSPPSSPICPSLAASTATLNSSICSTEIYENSSIISANSINSHNQQQQLHHHQPQQHQQQHQQPHMQWQQQQQQQLRQGTRRSWHVSPNKVITPQRHGDVYIYNCPAPNGSYHLQRQSLHNHHQQQSQSLQTTLQHQQQQFQQQQQHQIYSNQSIYQNRSAIMAAASSTNGAGSGVVGNTDFDTYDIPKPATPINYDSPKNVICRTPTSTIGSFRLDPFSLTMKANNGGIGSGSCSTPIQEESYDVPRPLNTLLHHQNTMTPSSSNSSLLTSDSLSLSFSSSNRSSLANMPDYDIPRRNPLPVRAVVSQQQQQQHHHYHHQRNQQYQQQPQQQQQQQQHFPYNANCMTYDFPLPSVTQSTPLQENSPQMATKELPLELSSALETLAKLQSEAMMAITRLLSFVSPEWRLREKLEPIIMEVKLAAVRLRTALHDLTEFSEGTLGNATRSEDRTLALKLRPLVRALKDADNLITDASVALDAHCWSVEKLARADDKRRPPDSLDQLIACVQTLIEDIRSTTSFIQGNAPLLFKRSPPENIINASAEAASACTPQTETENSNTNDGANGSNGAQSTTTTSTSSSSEWLEDYDYVSFESKDAAAKKNSSLREAIQPNLKNKFDTVLKANETTAMMASTAATPSATNSSSSAATTPTAAANKSFIDTISSSSSSKRNSDQLTDNDKLIVRYYAVQISTHMGNLRQAIDSFLETVEKNQPPKFFIAYGKFVVVSAHNLVMIGDNVHRNVSKTELREKILTCTNALSDALKSCVTKSKKASAHFPSVTAVQEMVDSVVDISHLAFDLKTAMLYAVQTTVN